jgi:hypothetical protein
MRNKTSRPTGAIAIIAGLVGLACGVCCFLLAETLERFIGFTVIAFWFAAALSALTGLLMLGVGVASLMRARRHG